MIVQGPAIRAKDQPTTPKKVYERNPKPRSEELDLTIPKKYTDIMKRNTQQTNAVGLGIKNYNLTANSSFQTYWKTLERKNVFNKTRMQLERILTDKGTGALIITPPFEVGGDPIISVAEVKEYNKIEHTLHYVKIKKTGFKQKNQEVSIIEEYNLATMQCTRVVEPTWIDNPPSKFDGMPDGWNFSALGKLPVTIFWNNDKEFSDYNKLELIEEEIEEAFAINRLNRKGALNRVLYAGALGKKDEENVEKAMYGGVTELKAFIKIDDNNFVNSRPMQTYNPQNSTQLSEQSFKQAVNRWKIYANVKKEVSDKGSVQQSSTEISQMNEDQSNYHKAKEILRVINFSDFFTKLMEYCSIYTTKIPKIADDEYVDFEYEEINPPVQQINPVPNDDQQDNNQNQDDNQNNNNNAGGIK